MSRNIPTSVLFPALLMVLLLPVAATGQILLNQPESVVYDQPRDRYLVSNFADGNIVQIDAMMQQSYFDTELTRTAGLFLDGDMLYVASNLAPTAAPPVAPPARVTLAENYPEPFNPTTLIEYSLPEAMPVRLEVFDCSGRLVDTVVDRWMGEGEHRVTWSGTGVGSGQYFYRLWAAGVTITKKMTIVK